jgi:small subunit ribosomal protein S8
MAINDPIADLLTRIRNALMAKHSSLTIGWSTIKENIVKILKDEGLIIDYTVQQEKNIKHLKIRLKYAVGRNPVIHGLKRVSKPGGRCYIQSKDVPHFFGNMGVAIVSTSQGVMTGSHAMKQNLGGELLCLVW